MVNGMFKIKDKKKMAKRKVFLEIYFIVTQEYIGIKMDN